MKWEDVTTEEEQDLEEIKKSFDEISKQLENKEQFLLNINHDLRSHLNVIISAIQYMQSNNKKTIKVDKYIEIIKKNSYKMLRLINNLIDTSKLENNVYTINKKNVDIVPMIEGTIGDIEKYAAKRNISLVFDTNEEECVIAVDIECIDRVVMNLLSNAIKFSNQDSKIYINLNVEKDYVFISFKDEGCGIPKEEQKKIFDRFYQCSSKRENENFGSGIGLDLSLYLVKAHNGELLLKSELGQGSEFTVKLPRVVLAEEENDNTDINLTSKVQTLEIEFSDIYN